MKMQGYIGDVHGKYEPYKRILSQAPHGSIQVGDMGVGFRIPTGPRMGEVRGNPPHYAMLATSARFIRGNHDNPGECKKHSQWINDGHVEDGMMFIGGASSIDKKYRTPDYSWWENEQLSDKEFENITKVYVAAKPQIMVTHECPQSLIGPLFSIHDKTNLEPDGTRTRLALERMLQLHRPKLWVFGHWHSSRDVVIEGTRFVCLAELEYKELPL